MLQGAIILLLNVILFLGRESLHFHLIMGRSCVDLQRDEGEFASISRSEEQFIWPKSDSALV